MTMKETTTKTTTTTTTTMTTSWILSSNLMVGRAYHAAVSINTGKLSCSGKR